VPLADRDEATRAALAGCDVDLARATEVWDDAVSAPAWDREPVWVHGDLTPLNLLVHEGRLSAVIDFGGLGVGDPACDVMVAWTFLGAAARETFRRGSGVDGDTWRRGRGWALSVAAIALPYYRDTNPAMAEASRRTLAATLEVTD
jgi:aminoglycoside phosphotransferase (APT) family kinase protein